MWINLWKVHYELLYEHNLDNNEYDFIERFIPISDDGTYSIDEDILKKAIIKSKETKTEVSDGLVKSLRKSIKDNQDSLEFRIF